MKNKIYLKICFISGWLFVALNTMAQNKPNFSPIEVYQSKQLIITQISKHVYQHTSFLQTQDFGYVPCNGMIVANQNEAIVFDTPTNDSAAAELIHWLTKTKLFTVNAVVPTHFHNDCLGGLSVFHQNKIASYGFHKTLALAKQNNYIVPQNGFADSLVLAVSKKLVVIKFFGEGHTIDNIVAYFAADNALFGGCLIKELNATKGYLGDANIASWSQTVQKIKAAYPLVKIVVPGHGQWGNKQLLDYTIQLFKQP